MVRVQLRSKLAALHEHTLRHREPRSTHPVIASRDSGVAISASRQSLCHSAGDCFPPRFARGRNDGVGSWSVCSFDRNWRLAMITAAKHSTWPLDVAIRDLESAGLPNDSVIRMKLFTLEYTIDGAQGRSACLYGSWFGDAQHQEAHTPRGLAGAANQQI